MILASVSNPSLGGEKLGVVGSNSCKLFGGEKSSHTTNASKLELRLLFGLQQETRLKNTFNCENYIIFYKLLHENF